jgi:hypothetical protein
VPQGLVLEASFGRRILRKLQVKKSDSQLRIPIQNFQIASDTSGLPYFKKYIAPEPSNKIINK